jgi:hypothetical protein
VSKATIGSLSIVDPSPLGTGTRVQVTPKSPRRHREDAAVGHAHGRGEDDGRIRRSTAMETSAWVPGQLLALAVEADVQSVLAKRAETPAAPAPNSAATATPGSVRVRRTIGRGWRRRDLVFEASTSTRQIFGPS